MKTMRKPVALALALVLSLSLLPNTALAAGDMGNFQRNQTYTAGQFTDVAQGEWYAESVKTAYELGLVKGSSDTTFAPGGSITVAATLALACRLHSIYETGAASFTQGDPWYQVYVDYAQQKGIFSAGAGVDFNAAATRRQFASILAKALPAEALTGKNSIPDGAIPDVATTDDSAADIYALYRAGVLTGNDALGTFAPESTIDRASVSAIVSRMADPALRKTLVLDAGLTGPYAGTLENTTYVGMDFEETKGTVSLKPSAFTGGNAKFTTFTTDGPKTQAEWESSYSSFLRQALLALEQDILKPNGYNLGQLGFTNF